MIGLEWANSTVQFYEEPGSHSPVAAAPVNVVTHGTDNVIAMRRTVISSKKDSRPNGVFTTRSISRLSNLSPTCGRPSLILKITSVSTPCARRYAAVPREASKTKPKIRQISCYADDIRLVFIVDTNEGFSLSWADAGPLPVVLWHKPFQNWTHRPSLRQSTSSLVREWYRLRGNGQMETQAF